MTNQVNHPLFSGERIIPSRTSYASYHQHASRYVFASRFVKGGEALLDVACGVGYGSSYLAGKKAVSVTGLDISPEAIDYARRTYGKERLTFVSGDAARLPFPRNSFNIIVSFETIEHLQEPRKFLSECQRVLQSGGSFICSTPNKGVSFPHAHKRGSPFHVKEYLPAEFIDLCCDYFGEISLYGQQEVNLVKYRLSQFIPGLVRLISAMALVEPVRVPLRKIYQRFRKADSSPGPTDKEINEDILDTRFRVGNFKQDWLHAPLLLIAVCRKQ